MFMDEVFINKAFENGLQAFKLKQEGQGYSLSHEFELNIVEFLVHLYGKINILNPYMIRNDDSLKENLTLYGATKEDIDTLFNLLNDYDKWLNSTERGKNTLIESIYRILAKLVVCKNNSMVVSDGEMRYYQDYFALTNKRVSQLVDMMAVSRENVVNALNNAIKEDEIEKAKPEPEPLYLAAAEYEKYGLDFEDVEKLPEGKVIELNQDIELKEEEAAERAKRFKPKQILLSSGNGFVDALVLFSIMCTEIMVGIVVTVIIARLG